MSPRREGWVYPERGDIVVVDVGHGRHHYVVISRDTRNQGPLNDFVAVGTTSKDKSALTGLGTFIQSAQADRPLAGWVKCDDVQSIRKSLPNLTIVGRVSPETMAKIDAGVRVALDL